MQRRKFLQFAVAAPAAYIGGEQTGCGESAKETKANPSAEVTWSRTVPVRYEADVAVIGGGIAGVSAACAAAKSGAKVILFERFAVCGGDLTSGGVANFCGQITGQGEVFDQILANLRAFGAIGQSRPVFHYEILAIVLQEMLLDRGVKLVLHTRFVDARVTSGQITECVICGKSGPEAVRAKQFIDCTGEADLARAADFPTMKGRPEDGLQLPMSMMFFVRHVEPKDAKPHLPDGWFEPIRARDELPMTSIWPDGPRSNAIKIKVPMFDATDTEGLTAAEIRARRRMMEVLDYYQRVEKKPWLLDHCSPIIGIREGARIVGDYVLTVDDLRAGREFDDAVARGVFYLDGHKPDDEKRTYILPEDQRHVPPYQIPFRSLIARDSKNLLAAGRSFSADQLALSSARVSTTCSMLGQAAGIAAAMAAERNCDPRDLEPAAVRRTIERRGAELAV
jgi:hypothetical protein